ncbi:MAG: hypothetical protein U1D36_23220 [Hydrogenophaga sp.]|nr:hypothetical protein [Hydrogenophaga sp.]
MTQSSRRCSRRCFDTWLPKWRAAPYAQVHGIETDPGNPQNRPRWLEQPHPDCDHAAGFRFPDAVREVFVHREGESVIPTPRLSNWSGFFSAGLRASVDFMEDTYRRLVQERSI